VGGHLAAGYPFGVGQQYGLDRYFPVRGASPPAGAGKDFEVQMLLACFAAR